MFNYYLLLMFTEKNNICKNRYRPIHMHFFKYIYKNILCKCLNKIAITYLEEALLEVNTYPRPGWTGYCHGNSVLWQEDKYAIFDFCKDCGICANECPKDAIEMVLEE